MTELEITPEPVNTPTPPYVPPKPLPAQASKSPLGPILVGFFAVIILSGLLGFFYFQAKFKSDLSSPSPTPSASPSSSPSPEPSVTPAELEPEPSDLLSKGGVKPTLKPVSAIKPIKSPTPTPVAQPTLDIRFGNPSANVKQTIDEGAGDGRVINREYSSVQSGQFDEVSSLWAPRVTVCYHLVASENIAGKDVKFSFSLDSNTEITDNLGGYDKIEAGRIYDWCHDTTTGIGKHTARMTINSDKSIKESNYNDNIARVDWENLPDKIAPNFTLTGPTQNSGKTCISLLYISDNVTKTSDLKIEEKFDSGSWSATTATTHCATGTAGSEHTYAAKITDARGNTNEQQKTFVLY